MELRTTQDEEETQLSSVKERGLSGSPEVNQDTPQEPASVVEIEALVKRLKSRYVGERKQAEEQLNSLGPDRVALLVELAKRERDKHLARRRIYFGLAASVATICVPATIYCLYECIVLAIAHNPAAGAYGGAIGGIVGGGGGGILGGFSWLLGPTPLQMSAAEALARVQDKRAAGPLAQVLDMSMYFELRYSAARALTSLLPMLTEDDGDLLDESQRAALRRALMRCHRDKEAEFAVAIMEALVRIGDVRSIPAIEQVSVYRANSPNERSVQDASLAAAAALKDIQQRSQFDSTLLRASDDSCRAAEGLLRAANGSPVESQDLLQASQEPEL
jgi:hypothetical protein